MYLYETNQHYKKNTIAAFVNKSSSSSKQAAQMESGERLSRTMIANRLTSYTLTAP
jgi:hypothetical protein